MRKINTLGLAICVALVVAVLAVGVALALPSNHGIDKAKGKSPAIGEDGNIVAPPAFVSPFPPQLSESELTKIVFIRYAPKFAKEKSCNNDGVCDPNEKGWCPDCKGGGEEEPPATTCYGFLAGSKPHWNWLENYYYSDSTLESSSAVTIWEDATSGDIFGDGALTTEDYEWGDYDYINSISYGDYPEEGVIAVTAIWFRGKNIYEYDIMFDEDFFPGDGSTDLATVVLHEFGHGAGLDDLYDVTCEGNVMYWRYTGPRTELNDGDTVGIQTLYGS